MTEKKLENFTFGKSPACVYLVALINKCDIKKYGKLHRKHQELNNILGELFLAYQHNFISLKNALHIINIKKEEVKEKISQLKTLEINKAKTPEEKDLATNIINVYSNVMMMEFKKIQRELQYYHIASLKSEQQARALSHNKNTPNEGLFRVRGQVDGIEYDSYVVLSKDAAPSITINTEFKDPINNEVLFKRHHDRMKRRNKQY